MNVEQSQATHAMLREVTGDEGGRRAADAGAGSSWATRAASLALLATLSAGVIALFFTVVTVFSDAWVGPAHLSPDSDQVLSLRIRVNQQLAEMARVEAELVRIDGELGAIDTAVERLQSLRANAREALTWTAEAETRIVAALQTSLDGMRSQLPLLEELRARQEAVLAEAEAAAAAGLATASTVEREKTALMRLDLSLVETRREIESLRANTTVARQRAAALQDGAGSTPRRVASPELGEVPEVVAREEQEVRLELELVGLEAERRGLEALRRAAAEGLARARALLDETKARPLYRAMEAATDVAFVPYEHLESVAPGHRVLQCVWGVFLCRDVGVVAEVLPGEVVTQDPWGELARGQYAILSLDDPEAIQERTLRVRAD